MARTLREFLGSISAYLLILAVFVIGLWAVDDAQDDLKETQLDLCSTAYDNRQAIRGLTVAIADLGADLVTGGAGKGATITPEQARSLGQFEAFKAAQLEQLDLPVCPHRPETESATP